MKLPNIPFINPKRDNARPVKRRGINVNPDESRIQREMDYDRRLDKPNGRLRRLENRIKAQKRRSYGR